MQSRAKIMAAGPEQAREVMQAFTAASRHVEKIRARLSEGQLLALYGYVKLFAPLWWWA